MLVFIIPHIHMHEYSMSSLSPLYMVMGSLHPHAQLTSLTNDMWPIQPTKQFGSKLLCDNNNNLFV